MRLIGLVAAVTVGLLATASHADEKKLNDPGTIIISAERLSGLFSYSRRSVTGEQAGVEVTSRTSSTTMGLLASPSPATFYTFPRFAFDYGVGGGLTLGASAMAFFTLSSKSERESGSQTQSEDSGKLTVLGIMPRVGYILPLGDVAAFWPRVGLSYSHVSIDSPEETVGGVTTSSSTSQSQLAVHVEPMFTLSPVNHFAFTLGPVVDIPLTGKVKSESTRNGVTASESNDSSQFHFGLTAGILGHF